MSEPKYADGLIVKAPREGAPEFVKGSISIKREELITWLSGLNDEWVNLDIKVSKTTGKWYAQINEWKPNAGKESDEWQKAKEILSPAQQITGQENPPTHADTDGIEIEDLPF